MSELISGKEALIALANGEEVQFTMNDCISWHDSSKNLASFKFLTDEYKFRLKPRTITLNGVEVPAPNYIGTDPNLYGGWAINVGTKYYMYKSKSDYDTVIAALHGALGKK